MHNPKSTLENETHKLLGDFGIQTDHPISARRTDLVINKKENLRIVGFAVPADQRVKLKESEKKHKYLDLVRELNKLWNIKVTVIQIVIGALGTVTKGLVQGLENLEIRGRVGTIQTTSLRSARILRRAQKLEKTCCHPRKKSSANAGVKTRKTIIHAVRIYS